ncbi:MAG: GyrI-like domain-containing protein [Planctomycetota bacterium]
MVRLTLTALLGAALCAACTSYSASQPTRPEATHGRTAPAVYVPDLPVAAPPYDTVQASWKQRLDQPYVYLEHVGSYTETGTLLPALHRELAAQGLEPAGAPFCLFYDDPALVPAYQLRSRACVPIEGARSPQSPLAYDVLPSTTVAYAYTSGAYPDAPRAYPGIYRYMQLMNWVENGPIREIYLVPPGPGTPYSELVCEIQIPSAPRIQ